MPVIEQDSRRITYESLGDPNNPTLLLISGLSSQLVNWPQDLLESLVAHHFHVIVFDNRDVGLSTYYDHLTLPNLAEVIALKQQGGKFVPPYTLEEMAADTIALMDGLKIQQAHMAGISMGGQIAQLLAIHYPERCLSLSCIATSSSNPNLPPPAQAVLDMMFKPVAPTSDLESFLRARLESYKIYNHPDDVDENEARQFLQAAYLRAYHPAGNMRQLLAVIAAEARSEKLQQVQLPALIIHGNYDPVFPIEHAEELAAVLPNSKLMVIDKLGHGLPKRVRSPIANSIAELKSSGRT